MYRSLIRNAVRRLSLSLTFVLLATLGGCQKKVVPAVAVDSVADEPVDEAELSISAEPRLVIHLTGARSTKGSYSCALFSDSGDFERRENPVHAENLAISDHSSWQIREVSSGETLPPGRYAVAIFHDENLNTKLDRHALGYPLEAYGFSNNARGKFGPPNFEAAAFQVGDEAVELTISLK